MNRFTRSRTRTAATVTAAGSVLLTSGLVGLGGEGVQASSHREAPLISGQPQYDTTDVYAFTSPDRRGSVTLIANWIPFEEPAGGPNFYPFATDARYDIKIDNNGDARPDITYRWTFKDHYQTRKTFLYNTGVVTGLRDPDLNFYQTYRLQRINAHGGTKTLIKRARVAPSDVGDASMPNYRSLRNQAVVPLGDGPTGGQSFAGQAEDPFFLDLRVFDLLYGGALAGDGSFVEDGDDTLAGFNVNTVALQVSKNRLAARHNVQRNPVIGIWSTTSKKGVSGKYHQVSRLGAPLVNEVVIPLKDKDRFNASAPRNDGQFLNYVTRPEVPRLIEAIYGIPAPDTPRNDLVQVFLTGVPDLNQPDGVTPSEQLRLNMTTPVTASPDRLGVIGGDVQGYPNGRRLADDVIDITLQVAEGELVGSENDLGDGVDSNDANFSDTFPYLALPASGSDASPHPAAVVPGGGSTPTGGLLGPDGVPALPLAAIGLGLLAMAGGVLTWLRKPGPVPA